MTETKNGGLNIFCPNCSGYTTVYNMAWSTIVCGDCHEEISNPIKESTNNNGKMTRIHGTETQQAKGFVLTLNIDMVNPDLTDEELAKAWLDLTSETRNAWELRMAAENRTVVDSR